MYNQEIKSRFIKEYTAGMTSEQTMSVNAILRRIEGLEKGWGADICTRRTEELQERMNWLCKRYVNRNFSMVSVLQDYVKWCIKNDIDGACDGMLHVVDQTAEDARRTMFRGPAELKEYLDIVYDPVDKETIDITYRTLYWLAFCGIPKDGALSVRTRDVDLRRKVIVFDGRIFQIYDEGYPAIELAVNLKSFAYFHPNYKEVIRRDRSGGNSIVRGIKGSLTLPKIRAHTQVKCRAAIADGRVRVESSYHRTFLSGVFYRAYQMEQAGVEPDFAQVALDTFKYHSCDVVIEKHGLTSAINALEASYAKNYRCWKAAFNL